MRSCSVYSPTSNLFCCCCYFYLFYLFWLCRALVAARGIFFYLVVACRLLSCGMHVGSSSLTRDGTWAPCLGSAESYPLDHQGSPPPTFFSPQFNNIFWRCFMLIRKHLCYLVSPLHSMDAPQCIYSFLTGGHSGCFCFSPLTSHAVVDILVCDFSC